MESINQEERYSIPTTDPVLEATRKSGANWFFWIAGLSLINSLIIVFEGNISFPVGLGLSQVLSAVGLVMSSDSGSSVYLVVSIVTSAFVSICFALIGYYSGRGFNTAFLVGIVLYLLDGFLCLIFSDFLAAGFHVFALIFIVKGFLANRGLKQMTVS